MRRILVALGAMAMVFATALPAHAGNWAMTELDPLPPELKPDTAYTVGYWVLQHGTHPFDVPGEDLGTTGLRLTSAEDGTALDFTGTPLPEPAHFVTTIKIPAGEWRVEGIQGIFMPHQIGTLTVPGGLTPAPPQFTMGADTPITDYWGMIKPPGFPWKGKVTATRPPPPAPTPGPTAEVGAPPQAVAVQPATAQPTALPAAPAAPVPRSAAETGTSDGGGWLLPYLLTAVAAAGATLLVQHAVRARAARAGAGPGSPDGEPSGPYGTGHASPPGSHDVTGDSGGTGRSGGGEADDVITIGRD
jgi:hypothetical protein